MNEVLIDGVAAMQRDDLAQRLWGELDRLSAQDQVVQAIVWGGEDISASVEEFLAQPPLEDRGALVIRSVAAAVLLEETVTASVGQMESLAQTVDQVVHHLRCGSDEEAMGLLPDLFDGLQNLAPLLEVLGSRQLLSAAEVETRVEELSQTLTQLMSTWQNENLVEMADLLKFDLRCLLIQTHDILSDLAVELTITRLSSRS